MSQSLQIMYGTAWKEGSTAGSVSLALDAGFRAIDTANQRKHYFEAGVGEAIAPFLVEFGRDALFLQTKYTYVRGQDDRLPYHRTARPSVQVQQSMESSLRHLGVDYVDSYLLHSPEKNSGGLTDTDWEVWQSMESLVSAGQTRSIGVSNVSAAQLLELVRGARVRPAFVQNRCYASKGWDVAVRTICNEYDVVYQGFSLLTANRKVWNGALVGKIAKRLDISKAAVMLTFARQMSMVPLTGTTDVDHMHDDLAAMSLVLWSEEIAQLEKATE